MKDISGYHWLGSASSLSESYHIAQYTKSTAQDTTRMDKTRAELIELGLTDEQINSVRKTAMSLAMKTTENSSTVFWRVFDAVKHQIVSGGDFDLSKVIVLEEAIAAIRSTGI